VPDHRLELGALVVAIAQLRRDGSGFLAREVRRSGIEQKANFLCGSEELDIVEYRKSIKLLRSVESFKARREARLHGVRWSNTDIPQGNKKEPVDEVNIENDLRTKNPRVAFAGHAAHSFLEFTLSRSAAGTAIQQFYRLDNFFLFPDKVKTVGRLVFQTTARLFQATTSLDVPEHHFGAHRQLGGFCGD